MTELRVICSVPYLPALTGTGVVKERRCEFSHDVFAKLARLSSEGFDQEQLSTAGAGVDAEVLAFSITVPRVAVTVASPLGEVDATA